jgi:hypothetical protein
MNCATMLWRGFIGCCLLAATCGAFVGLSCEIRRKPDCLPAWDQGGKMALAAAGFLTTALAKFPSGDGP